MSDKKNPKVTIQMQGGGKIVIELLPDTAPGTVKNFISLAGSGFYDGTIFHRVIPDFMIQGGDPDGTGMGGAPYRIKGEFAKNGVKNDLGHTRGVCSMARSASPDSASSQFFICVTDCSWLDGSYATFGRVVSGMDVADAIVSAERDGSDRPHNPQVMEKVTVDTFGADYGEPEKL